MRSFLSGNGTRGEDIFEHILYSELPTNLEFDLIQDEYPINLLTDLTLNGDESAVEQYQTSEKLNSDETSRQEIMELLWRLTEIGGNAKELSRLYFLEDGKVMLANYSGSGLQYSNWVMFGKKEASYKIVMIALIR